ncbi:hypothetical protein JCM10295v2_005025 [Rhodotorula toruloides]
MLRSPLFRAFTRSKSTLARSAEETGSAAAAVAAREGSSAGATTSSNDHQDRTFHASNPSKVHSDSHTPHDRPARKDPAEAYKQLLEERFGGADSAALGTLVNGQPEGLAPNGESSPFARGLGD